MKLHDFQLQTYKDWITFAQKIKFVSRRSVQLADVIRMLIGLTDIFANHTKQKGSKE